MPRVKAWVHRHQRTSAAVVLTVGALLLVLPFLVSRSVSQVSAPSKSYREILNDVHDRANHRLMSDPWAGGLATAQGQLLTEVEIWNDVYDDANHRLNVSGTGGGGGSGAFADITSGTNNTAAMVVAAPGSLSGNITASTALALSADPVACLTSPQRVVVDFAANGTLVCQQLSFADLSGTVAAAQMPLLNTVVTGLLGSRCVETTPGGLLSVAASACGTGGGSGISGATTNGLVVATGATTATSLGVATAGQIPIGSPGANPVLAVPQGTANQIEVVPGAGSLVFRFPPAGVTLPGTTTGTFTGALTGNAATASALSTNPLPCGANLFVSDIAADGTLLCTQPVLANLSGPATDAQIPDLNVLGTGLTGGRCVRTNNASGALEVAAGDCGTTTAAPVDAPYWLSGASGPLTSETNLGLLPSGILKHTVSGNFSTPATAVAGTDYLVPGGALGTPSSATLTNATGLPFTGVTGTASDAQILDLNVLSTGLTPSRCVETDGTGKLGVAASTCGTGSGSTGITGATNNGIMIATGGTTGTSLGVATNGQLPIGSTGASPVLSVPQGTANQIEVVPGAGSLLWRFPATGVILPGTTTANLANATGLSLAGGHGTAPAGDDQVFVSDSTTVGTWKTLPNCGDTGGQHLNYAAATNTWSCGTTSSAAGSAAFSALTSGTNTTAAMIVGSNASLTATGTGNITATTVVDNSITLPKLADIATASLLGRQTAGTGDPEVLNATQAKTLLSLDQVTNTSDATKWTSTKTLTNTRVTKRVWSPANAATLTIDANQYDRVKVAELLQDTTFDPPSPYTPALEDALVVEICTTLRRAITFSPAANGFIAGHNLVLPTTNDPGTCTKHLFEWNGSKWSFISSTMTTNRGNALQVWTSGGGLVEPGWAAPQAGGGGTTGERFLPVSAVGFPSSGAATLEFSGIGGSHKLLFSNSTKQCAFWGPFPMNVDYASAPVFRLDYSMTSVVSSSVTITVRVMAITPGTDAHDPDADANYDGVNTCTDAAVPGTAGVVDRITCPLTTNDSLLARDLVKIELCRNTGGAAGIMEALVAVLEYTK